MSGLRAVISYLEFQISNGLRVISNLETFRNFTLEGEGLPTRLRWRTADVSITSFRVHSVRLAYGRSLP